MKKAAFLLLFILILSGCSEKSQLIDSPKPPATPDPCPAEQINQFLEFAESAESRLTELTRQADSTPGEELEPIIKEMQVIESEAKEIDPPSCALKAKSALTSYLETLIQGYFRLYTQGIGITPLSNARSADDEFNLAASKLEYYETEKEALRNLLQE